MLIFTKRALDEQYDINAHEALFAIYGHMEGRISSVVRRALAENATWILWVNQ